MMPECMQKVAFSDDVMFRSDSSFSLMDSCIPYPLQILPHPLQILEQCLSLIHHSSTLSFFSIVMHSVFPAVCIHFHLWFQSSFNSFSADAPYFRHYDNSTVLFLWVLLYSVYPLSDIPGKVSGFCFLIKTSVSPVPNSPLVSAKFSSP